VNYVAVIPSIYQPYTDACVASCKLDNLIVVDNTVNNRGVSASWNIGVKAMYETGSDWLIIISAAVRFGAPGGLDLVESMRAHPDAFGVGGGLDGWHLIAFHRRTFDAAGWFDENFYPAYFEDADFGRRVSLWKREAGLCVEPLWVNAPIDGSLESVGHAVRLGGVRSEAAPLLHYYRSKWGGSHGTESFSRPFNNSSNPLSFWPEPCR
jgi:hypothetical protein